MSLSLALCGHDGRVFAGVLRSGRIDVGKGSVGEVEEIRPQRDRTGQFDFVAGMKGQQWLKALCQIARPIDERGLLELHPSKEKS